MTQQAHAPIDARFGKWVSCNFHDTTQDTLRRSRRLWEVFSERREEVAFIPQSGLIDGPNPDERFGKWVSLNFKETGWQTIRQARRLWEVFSNRREDVAFIPHSPTSALYFNGRKPRVLLFGMS